MKRSLVVLCLSLLMAQAIMCGRARAGNTGQPLTAADLAQIFGTPHKEAGVSNGGTSWTIEVLAGGNLTLHAGTFSDVGHGKLQGDTYCTTWNKAGGGKETCWHYTRLDNNKYASFGPDGKQDSIFQIVK